MIIPIYGKIKHVPNHQPDEQTWKAMKIVFKTDEKKWSEPIWELKHSTCNMLSVEDRIGV